MLANVTYRFRIINLTKKNSLYNEGRSTHLRPLSTPSFVRLGMQILLFSDVDSKKQSQGWHRVGHHINYAEHRQRTYNLLLERDMTYYELDFQFVSVKTSVVDRVKFFSSLIRNSVIRAIRVTLRIVILTRLLIWKMISIICRPFDLDISFVGMFSVNLERVILVSSSRWPMKVGEEDFLFVSLLIASSFLRCANPEEEVRFHHRSDPSGWDQFQLHDAWFTRVHHLER